MLKLAIALPLLLGTQPPGPSADEAGVRKAFAQYRTALMKKDGASAADAVDTETLAYDDKMRGMALSAEADSVKKLGFLDRLMVLRLRRDVQLEKLRTAYSRLNSGYGFFP